MYLNKKRSDELTQQYFSLGGVAMTMHLSKKLTPTDKK